MESTKDLPCTLCLSKNKDDLKYGKFYVNDGLGVHYFCLLLSSNLCQKGKDNEGILGFLPKDIRREAKRIRCQICVYCGKESANIGCCHIKCRREFHLICGIENGAQNQFLGTFRSFCDRDLFKSIRRRPPTGETCTICYEDFTRDDLFTMSLCSPCCKNGWFHKWCLQEFANHAGYFFKCPLCNDKEKFWEKLPYLGIFVPEKDADWELEPNAFQELLERPNRCSARSCLCESGRKFTDKNKFSFNYCSLCGSKAIHKSCKLKTLKYKNRNYNCSECEELLKNTSFRSSTRDSGIAGIEIEKSSNEDEFVDVEDVDESEKDIIIEETDHNLRSQHKIINISSDEIDITKEPHNTEVKHCKSYKNSEKNSTKNEVDPSIIENVKNAFDNFESARNFRKRRLESSEFSSSDCLETIKQNLIKNKSQITQTPSINRKILVYESDLDCFMNFNENEEEKKNNDIDHNLRRRNNDEYKEKLRKSKIYNSCYSDSSSVSVSLSCIKNIRKKSMNEPHKSSRKKRKSDKKSVELPLHSVASTSANRLSSQKTGKRSLESVIEKTDPNFSLNSKKQKLIDASQKTPKSPRSSKRTRSGSLYKVKVKSLDKNRRRSLEHNKRRWFNSCETDEINTKERKPTHESLSHKLSTQSSNNIFNDVEHKNLNNKNKLPVDLKSLRLRNIHRQFNRDQDSDSSVSSTSADVYFSNKNVLKKNAEQKISPINRKIKSKTSKI